MTLADPTPAPSMISGMPVPVVSAEWLKQALGAPDLRVIDASWRLPAAGAEPAIVAHEKRRIDGAVFFDIDAIADPASDLPHMLPTAADFGAAVGALGISAGDRVVVYDDIGVFSAARVWWTFRVFGHEAVSVLDGGLPAWIEAGGACAEGRAHPVPSRYTPRGYNADLVADAASVCAAIAVGGPAILDARPPGRFAGIESEPRTGLRGGAMPGAINVPYLSLLTEAKRLLDAAALTAVLGRAGHDISRPAVASCGSGITAAVIALALARLGNWRTAVYDGSWAEWGRADPEGRRPVTGVR